MGNGLETWKFPEADRSCGGVGEKKLKPGFYRWSQPRSQPLPSSHFIERGLYRANYLCEKMTKHWDRYLIIKELKFRRIYLSQLTSWQFWRYFTFIARIQAGKTWCPAAVTGSDGGTFSSCKIFSKDQKPRDLVDKYFISWQSVGFLEARGASFSFLQNGEGGRMNASSSYFRNNFLAIFKKEREKKLHAIFFFPSGTIAIDETSVGLFYRWQIKSSMRKMSNRVRMNFLYVDIRDGIVEEII